MLPDGRVKEDRALASTEAQTLLVALRNVIIPLVGGNTYIHSDSFGAEGQEFLGALQKFVSCVAISQPGHQYQRGLTMGIEATRSPEMLSTTASESIQLNGFGFEDNDDESSTELPMSSSVLPEQDTVIVGSSKQAEQIQRQPTALEKVLTELRLRVFNKMPIRMLCFKTRRSKFHITLLERGQIYAHLARKLQADFDNDKFLSDIARIGYTTQGGDQSWAEQTVIRNWVSRVAKYATLSHTWLRGVSGEVTYADWHRGTYNTEHPGYQKLRNFCKVAAADHGLTLGWMDTVCINKDSSSELDESIRSMYQWYQDSKICITYLAETWGLAHMHQDPWFTRGWTLQELLAPPSVKFYAVDWKQLVENQSNDKADTRIRQSIEIATTITPIELYTVNSLPISRKMQWASQRQVTREEDIAYCLMGIFRVSISIAYGEGARRAFFRLVQEILNSSEYILDLFNWAGNGGNKMVSSLLPPSPAAYLHRHSSSEITLNRPSEPLTLTHLGLRIPVLLVPGMPTNDSDLPFRPIGDYYGSVSIVPTTKHGHPIFLAASLSPLSSRPDAHEHEFPQAYNLLDTRVSGALAVIEGHRNYKVAFGILNFQSTSDTVTIPKQCLAMAFLYTAGVALEEIMGVSGLLRVQTQVPIVFQLKKTLRSTKIPTHNIQRLMGEPPSVDHAVPRSDLAHHGMRVLTVYL